MKILIIDDDPHLASMLEKFLLGIKHETVTASTAGEGLKLFESFLPDLVVLDHRLPDRTGLELLPLLRERRPHAAVLLITGEGSTRDAVAAMKLGAENYLEKPFELDELQTLVEALEERQKKGAPAARASDAHADYLFLESESMKEIYQSIQQVADKDTSVLILGPTGTGKEHAARLMHTQSRRASGPFISLHCAALPETLLESELFGYDAGAFTDARKSKPGLLEQAQGGTLFLDEIGELPLSTQAKLLKVLEEKRLRRLGSVKEVNLDLRLVCATQRDLEHEMNQRRFRQDLYYRLNVVTLRLPGLKGRQEDIRALSNFYFDKFRAAYNPALPPLSEEVMARLQAMPWPGNVRELRNLMERLAIRAQAAVEAEDLRQAAGSAAGAGGGAVHMDPASLRLMLEECRWNRSLTAERLGISRPTLLKWMRRFDLL